MHCYRCEREAVERCYTCGILFCQEHGDVNCDRCNTGIAPGDLRTDRIAARPMPVNHQSGWWRPQRAEEFVPPACYQCRGLARRVCRHCQNYYCPEHAGALELCAGCDRSSMLGLYILIGMITTIGMLIWLGW